MLGQTRIDQRFTFFQRRRPVGFEVGEPPKGIINPDQLDVVCSGGHLTVLVLSIPGGVQPENGCHGGLIAQVDAYGQVIAKKAVVQFHRRLDIAQPLFGLILQGAFHRIAHYQGTGQHGRRHYSPEQCTHVGAGMML